MPVDHRSGAIVTTRTARSHHICDDQGCWNTVAPGERYVRTSLPPYTDVNSGPHWWTMKLCRQHADYYGHGHLLSS